MATGDNEYSAQTVNLRPSFLAIVGAKFKYWVSGECSHEFKRVTGHTDMGDHLAYTHTCPVCFKKDFI